MIRPFAHHPCLLSSSSAVLADCLEASVGFADMFGRCGRLLWRAHQLASRLKHLLNYSSEASPASTIVMTRFLIDTTLPSPTQTPSHLQMVKYKMQTKDELAHRKVDGEPGASRRTSAEDIEPVVGPGRSGVLIVYVRFETGRRSIVVWAT